MARRERQLVQWNEEQPRLGPEASAIAMILGNARALLGATESVVEVYFCKQGIALNPDG